MYRPGVDHSKHGFPLFKLTVPGIRPGVSQRMVVSCEATQRQECCFRVIHVERGLVW